MAKEKKIYDTGFVRADRSLRGKDLEKEYHRLAKAADRRLRNLEKLSDEQYYEHVLEWAYAGAQNYIQQNINPEGTRFDVSVRGLGTKAIQARINAIEEFMLSPTSTKKGITKSYKQRVETFNKRIGSNFTWQEFAGATEKEKWNELKDILGSETFSKIVGKVKKNEKQIKKIIEDAKQNNVKDSILHEGLKKATKLSEVDLGILEANGIDLEEFIF